MSSLYWPKEWGTHPKVITFVIAPAVVLFQKRSARGTASKPLSGITMVCSPLDVLVRKLESIGPLSKDEQKAIYALPLSIRSVPEHQDVVHDGARPTQSCVVLEGFLCRYKQLPDGTRQIHSIHVPGDMPDLQSLHLNVMDHGLATLTASKVAFISHAALRSLTREQPRVSEALWRDILVDAAIFREWIVNVGAREAYARLAHLLCELFLKLRAVGLTQDFAFQLPITQAELADATGLSTVHVNRSVMHLRSAGLITWERGECKIENWEELKRVAMFDPTYLHLNSEAKAA